MKAVFVAALILASCVSLWLSSWMAATAGLIVVAAVVILSRRSSRSQTDARSRRASAVGVILSGEPNWSARPDPAATAASATGDVAAPRDSSRTADGDPEWKIREWLRVGRGRHVAWASCGLCHAQTELDDVITPPGERGWVCLRCHTRQTGTATIVPVGLRRQVAAALRDSHAPPETEQP